MKSIPITLGIARPVPTNAGDAKQDKSGAGSSGSAVLSSAGGKVPAELKTRIHERDDHTCRCCGFRSEKYQEIHFLNNNKSDLREDNLATVCIFCHQCFNLDQVNDMRSGALIWMPEISQEALHHIARAIYVARISQGPTADAARQALETIINRRKEAVARIGTDRPYILSMVLRDYLGAKHYAARDKKLDGIRLFPLDRRIIKEADLEFNQFPQILAFWRSKKGPFGGKSPPQWVNIYHALSEKAA